MCGRDRLAGMIAECSEHPIPRPADFPGDSDEARSMVPRRVVRGIDGRSLYDVAISFLRPAIGDFTQILKGYGVNVVNEKRGRHPFKYQIPGQPLHPLTVGPDGRIADRLIAEMEDALNVPRGQIRRELQLSGKALRAQRRRTMTSVSL